MDKGDNPLTPEDLAALLEDLEALLGRCLPDPWLTMSNSRSSFSAHTRSQVTPRMSLSIHWQFTGYRFDNITRIFNEKIYLSTLQATCRTQIIPFFSSLFSNETTSSSSFIIVFFRWSFDHKRSKNVVLQAMKWKWRLQISLKLWNGHHPLFSAFSFHKQQSFRHRQVGQNCFFPFKTRTQKITPICTTGAE